MRITRRRFSGQLGLLAGISGASPALASQDGGAAAAEWLPAQDPAVVRETVAVSHGNLARVRELIEKQPALANAAIDWGFGDWESALGAASHVGRRDIAELLLANGARPTIFSATMLGHVDVVKAFVAASPGIQRVAGPHGITLLAHARAGGAAAALVVTYLESLGDADRHPATEPLDAAERGRLVGEYGFGGGPRDYFVIDVRDDQLGIERPGQARRLLFHTGGLVFFPTGAPSVRIAFSGSAARIGRLTVADPEVILTATRRA